MQYTELLFTLSHIDPYRDILVAELAEGPFDSFEDTPTGFRAFVPTHLYNEASVRDLLVTIRPLAPDLNVSFVANALPDTDWNAEWEKSHQPVLVEDFCWVRAPFHPRRADVPFDVVIDPKMSFGTAHHATTYMMLSFLRDIPLSGSRVLDMGCGTAVLAILAALRGASSVVAIDVDEWAYNNAVENVRTNHVDHCVSCLLADASSLSQFATNPFNVILANINRNILLRDMSAYSSVLAPGGTILFSGFYHSDAPAIVSMAETLHLSLADSRLRDDWCSLRFVKRCEKE